jgi:predicted component of type VI protein secretion system
MSRTMLSPNNELIHEIQRLDHTLQQLENKIASSEEMLVAKVAEKLAQNQNVDQRLAQMEQNIKVATNRIQNHVLEKVTEMITDNIDELIPELPSLIEKVSMFEASVKKNRSSKDKMESVALEAKLGLDELKNEFD